MTSDQDLAAPGTIWVCPACGRSNRNRMEMGDTSCVTWAVLCFEKTDNKAAWTRVPKNG